MSDRIAVFNDGRIEQVGTPAELYEQPATAFVAGFVGTSNLLEGDGRRARCSARDGTFSVRPEKIHLVAPRTRPRRPTARRARRPGVVRRGRLPRVGHALAGRPRRRRPRLTVAQQNTDRSIDSALERGTSPSS